MGNSAIALLIQSFAALSVSKRMKLSDVAESTLYPTSDISAIVPSPLLIAYAIGQAVIAASPDQDDESGFTPECASDLTTEIIEAAASSMASSTRQFSRNIDAGTGYERGREACAVSIASAVVCGRAIRK